MTNAATELTQSQNAARAVEAAGSVKPVFAHVDGAAHSAAFWVASMAHRITATRTSAAGSIGIMAVLKDTSGAAETKAS